MANTSKRGFASMDTAKQREIASKGGRAAHAKGTAHEFSSDEARVAGRKGGEAVSRDRAHMSAIGREGGHSRGRARQQPSQENISSGAVIDNERASFGVERANDRGASESTQRTERTGEPNRNENVSYPNR
jgi:uncharacterized protein